MITFENTEVVGWEAAIRGMRNPLESWDKSDSSYCNPLTKCYSDCEKHECEVCDHFTLGPNDLGLMKRLCKAGTDHRKFMRMLVVYVDITAPLYWWKEFDTYKVGTVANSCSTMHCIHKKEFTLDDFSREHLDDAGLYFLETIIDTLNSTRLTYLEGGSNWIGDRRKSSESEDPNEYARSQIYKPKDKRAWWQMIQLLPSSYNQKRTVMLNYEVLANIYKSRKDHKLTEWSEGFIEWIKTLPYSELIKGENYED